MMNWQNAQHHFWQQVVDSSIKYAFVFSYLGIPMLVFSVMGTQNTPPFLISPPFLHSSDNNPVK